MGLWLSGIFSLMGSFFRFKMLQLLIHGLGILGAGFICILVVVLVGKRIVI